MHAAELYFLLFSHLNSLLVFLRPQKSCDGYLSVVELEVSLDDLLLIDAQRLVHYLFKGSISNDLINKGLQVTMVLVWLYLFQFSFVLLDVGQPCSRHLLEDLS